MKNAFDSKLDATASAISLLFPHKIVIALRLLIDYKTADGVDHNKDALACVSRGTTTAKLVESVRADLPAGCTLSAISSADYSRPIYAAPGFIEETIMEQQDVTPEKAAVLADAVRTTFITLEEIFEREDTAND